MKILVSKNNVVDVIQDIINQLREKCGLHWKIVLFFLKLNKKSLKEDFVFDFKFSISYWWFFVFAKKLIVFLIQSIFPIIIFSFLNQIPNEIIDNEVSLNFIYFVFIFVIVYLSLFFVFFIAIPLFNVFIIFFYRKYYTRKKSYNFKVICFHIQKYFEKNKNELNIIVDIKALSLEEIVMLESLFEKLSLVWNINLIKIESMHDYKKNKG